LMQRATAFVDSALVLTKIRLKCQSSTFPFNHHKLFQPVRDREERLQPADWVRLLFAVWKLKVSARLLYTLEQHLVKFSQKSDV
jgi:hypothetical protein